MKKREDEEENIAKGEKEKEKKEEKRKKKKRGKEKEKGGKDVRGSKWKNNWCKLGKKKRGKRRGKNHIKEMHWKAYRKYGYCGWTCKAKRMKCHVLQ